jgi:arylsulfatase A-like enzyme
MTTLVLFTSDNGPWLSYGNHAGSAGPLREGKGTTWDGGHLEPTLARWPGKVPAGSTCGELAGAIDVLPTFAKLAGGEAPQDRIIDGRNIWPLLSGQPGAKSPHEAFYYYWALGLEAVQNGWWKLHLPLEYRTLAEPGGKDGQPGPYKPVKTELALYHLADDAGESHPTPRPTAVVGAQLASPKTPARRSRRLAYQPPRHPNRRPSSQLK